MADTLVEGSAYSQLHGVAFSNAGPFWLDPNVGAIVYVNSGNDVVARKTTDAGASWGSAQAAEAGSALAFTCWFDQQTPGDTGTKVHVVWVETASDLVRYAAFDIDAGTWSTPITLQSSYTPGTILSLPVGSSLFVGKTRNGNLLAGWSAVSPACYRSTDGGANWTSRASPWESTAVDQVMFVCPNTGDGADGGLIFWDISANELSVKMYDDSANSWTETSIATSMTEAAYYLQFAIATRHSDGCTILAAWSYLDAATADLRVWQLTLTTISSVGVSALADVLTNTVDAAVAGVIIDPSNEDIYVCYLRGTTWESLTGAFYKVSTDNGSSWGDETALSEDAEDDNRLISAGAASPTGGGRFQPWWFDDDDNDIFINLNTDIQFTLPTIVSPASADLEVEGFAPSLTLQVTPATADIEVEGFAPSVVVGKVFEPAAADIEFEGFAPNLTLQVTPSAEDLEIEGFAPTVVIARGFTPTTQTVLVEGFAPSVNFAINLNPATQDLSIEGFTPEVAIRKWADYKWRRQASARLGMRRG